MLKIKMAMLGKLFQIYEVNVKLPEILIIEYPFIEKLVLNEMSDRKVNQV